MKIAVGADSAGKPLLDVIEAHLKSKPEHQITNLSQSGNVRFTQWLQTNVVSGQNHRLSPICHLLLPKSSLIF